MPDQDLDRIADIVASRIRAQLGGATPTQTNAVPSSGSFHGAAAAGAPSGGGSPQTIDHALAKMIDHTLLKPEVTRDELVTLCDEARQYSFKSVCVNSSNVALCAEELKGAKSIVCAVVGFPLGAMAPHAKAFETREAVRQGASEIDMVINIGALCQGDYTLVTDDIRKVVTAARPAHVKVILETSKLTEEQKVAACTLAKLAGAHFVKTSTGFGGGGATTEDIALMRRVVGPDMGVKASGGVHSAEEAAALIAAGATRIGASASVAIVTGGQSSGAY
ncbi:MAG: deoxyribose-phosphate aldolase [Deltaproteobacteria bacterium]|nr:deoxyribose-phosphate aldolase [Deltaproteobacteria bacterium]